MTADRSARRRAGLELKEGDEVGRDPRTMSQDELREVGHVPMSPLEALRQRCLDCCAGSPGEVRLCVSVECPAWPFRMGKNPWRAPPSEARKEAGRALAARRARGGENQRQERGPASMEEEAATTLPADPPDGGEVHQTMPQSSTVDAEGGA